MIAGRSAAAYGAKNRIVSPRRRNAGRITGREPAAGSGASCPRALRNGVRLRRDAPRDHRISALPPSAPGTRGPPGMRCTWAGGRMHS